jgi:hypothetical protein
VLAYVLEIGILPTADSRQSASVIISLELSDN